MIIFCILTLYYYAAYCNPLAFHYSINKIHNKCISQVCNALTNGSQTGEELNSWGHLETFLLITTERGVAVGIWCVEIRDVSKYPAVNGTDFL